MPRVKFCGLTSLEDAQAAVDLGADLLGFNFYPKSPRYISPEGCAAIIAGLEGQLNRPNGRVITVGIFVNHLPDEVITTLKACRLDLAQLSGDEPPEDLRKIGSSAFKVVRLGKDTKLDETIHPYLLRQLPPAFLIDASVPGTFGGTGQSADWDQARLAAEYFPILLAGGLHHGNIARAVQQVQPWGVDVASGIESALGKKDYHKMAEFIQAVRRVEKSELTAPARE